MVTLSSRKRLCQLSIALDNEAYIKRALLFIKMEKFEKALLDIDEALVLDENNPLAHLYRGIVYRNMGRFADSLKSYDTALKNMTESKRLKTDKDLFNFKDYYGKQNEKLSEIYSDMESLNKKLKEYEKTVKKEPSKTKDAPITIEK